ncbi:hypothetical protein KUTeg_011557 [Tegillarca granosa]|uniref:THAP-type domain-containing protein n=1 Tax=Tegillarca granosa TaxID=220873 RepID=A0ABQ9F0C0_TEGGR|nr:hypothetical protein KUTeg_011557 [Tegillarca granosa]
MVKTCSWGTCNSDTRHPGRIQNVAFIPFPKPKTNWEKCLRWVKACGRPHSQLNPANIDRHKFVCTKFFLLDSILFQKMDRLKNSQIPYQQMDQLLRKTVLIGAKDSALSQSRYNLANSVTITILILLATDLIAIVSVKSIPYN